MHTTTAQSLYSAMMEPSCMIIFNFRLCISTRCIKTWRVCIIERRSHGSKRCIRMVVGRISAHMFAVVFKFVDMLF